MSHWPSVKAGQLLKALLGIGWNEKHRRGSHRVLEREGWADYTFAFHDGEEIGPVMVARVAKKTGLQPTDL
ncbi:MAG: type II toxin-antitoxin system HicA family toxin [Vicinamibacterales bacterium]